MKVINAEKLYVLLIAIMFSALGCLNKNNVSTGVRNDGISLSSEADLSLNERSLLHYWDGFDFSDSAAVRNPEVGEQKLVDFIAAFPNVSDTVRTKAINKMLFQTQRDPASFQYFIEQFDHYLYNPNSPMRNDLYYESVLSFVVNYAELSDAEQLSYSNLLALVRKNQVGAEAKDFPFLSSNGDNLSLHKMDAPMTVLFFYEPGCSFCKTSIKKMVENSSIKKMISNGALDILAIYPYGDLNSWKAYQKHIPANWINGFDSHCQILENSLYDIRATPTIYLLDQDKNVLLKDTDLIQLTGVIEVALY